MICVLQLNSQLLLSHAHVSIVNAWIAYITLAFVILIIIKIKRYPNTTKQYSNLELCVEMFGYKHANIQQRSNKKWKTWNWIQQKNGIQFPQKNSIFWTRSDIENHHQTTKAVVIATTVAASAEAAAAVTYIHRTRTKWKMSENTN